MVEKEKYWFKTGLDFGFLFLTWLQKTSLAYKMLMDTRPNFMTIRYEWKDSIDYEINPEKAEYLKYFTEYWDEEMVAQFFPQKSKTKELFSSTGSLVSIFFKGIARKISSNNN